MATIPRYAQPQAVETPQLGLNAIQFNPGAVAGAGQALAQGVASFARDMGDIAIKIREAKDAQNLVDANLAMQDQIAKFADWQRDHPNEEEWLGEAQARLQKMQGDFDQMRLSPQARLRMQEQTTQFATRFLTGVKAEAAKQTERRYAASIDAAFALAKRTGDTSVAAQAIEDAPAWMMPPETKDLAREQLKTVAHTYDVQEYTTAVKRIMEDSTLNDTEKGQQRMQLAEDAFAADLVTPQEYAFEKDASIELIKWGDFTSAARVDPKGAVARLDKGEFGAFNDAMKDKARKAADAMLAEYQEREVVEFSNQLASGSITKVGDYPWKWTKQDPAKMQQIVAEMSKAPMTPKQAATSRLALEGAIEAYTLDGDKDRSQLVGITSMLGQMPADMVSDLRAKLKERVENKQPGPNEIAIGVFKKTLGEQMKPDFAYLFDDKGVLKPGMDAAYMQRLLEQEQKMQRFKALIGPEPTYEQVRKASETVLGEAATRQLMNYFQGVDLGITAPPAPVDRLPANNRREGIDASLFPPLTPGQ